MHTDYNHTGNDDKMDKAKKLLEEMEALLQKWKEEEKNAKTELHIPDIDQGT